MYRWIRDLHLYFGLFISPFVLLFAASVFYLNHGTLVPALTSTTSVSQLQIPDGFDRLKGKEAVERARELLPQLGVEGEIGFLRYVANDRRLIFPVLKAGVETTVDVDVAGSSATVKVRRMGFWESVAYLHKLPGPHNVAIRGNWVGTQVWRGLADATICLLIFITVSGVYLWLAIKAERRIGAVMLSAGAATFVGLIYALTR